MSVCLSDREDISGTTRAIFTKFCVHIAHVRGSVLRHVDDRPRRLSAIRGCTARAKCNLRLPCFERVTSHPKLLMLKSDI